MKTIVSPSCSRSSPSSSTIAARTETYQLSYAGAARTSSAALGGLPRLIVRAREFVLGTE
jgi:hypothetical protein